MMIGDASMRIKLNRATKIIMGWLDQLAKGIYNPIVTVWSSPKGNRRHILKGVKSGREHHLLSDGEYREGIYRESLPQTKIYYEQCPLWDVERAIRIAHDMGIKYPVDEDGEAYILSTDFLCEDINLKTGEITKVARSYKPIDSLSIETKHPVSVTRTFQKIELEYRYYAEIGVKFELITDLDISKACARHLKWARKPAFFTHEFIQHEEAFLYSFLNNWQRDPLSILEANIARTNENLHISYSDAFCLFQWCLWSHKLPVDLEQRINPLRPIVFKGGR